MAVADPHPTRPPGHPSAPLAPTRRARPRFGAWARLALLTVVVVVAGVAVAAAIPLHARAWMAQPPALLTVPRAPGLGGPACTGEARDAVGNAVLVDMDEVLCGRVSAYGGNVTVLGQVEGDVTAVGGSVIVGGTVYGNVTAIGGDVTLLANAQVTGDAQAWGGIVRRSPAATVGGATSTGPELHDIFAWRDGTWGGSPFPGMSWPGVLFWTLVAAGFARFFSQPLRHVAYVARTRPAPGLIVGLVTLVLATILAALLVITFVGIVLALGLVLVLWCAWVLGTVALGLTVGEWLLRVVAMGKRPPIVVASVLGTFVLTAVEAVPLVGGIVSLFAGAIGLGATVLSLLSARRPHP